MAADERGTAPVTSATGANRGIGFEPLAKIPMGLALRRWDVARRGLMSAGAGYLALIIAAALAFLVLRLTGVTTAEEFLVNPEVETIASPTLRDILVSACGAVAGMLMVPPTGTIWSPGR